MRSFSIKKIVITRAARQSLFSTIKRFLKRSISIIAAIVFVSNFAQEAQAKNTKYSLKTKAGSASTKSKKSKSINTKTSKKTKKTKQKKASSKNEVPQVKKSTTPEVEVPKVGAVEKTRIIK